VTGVQTCALPISGKETDIEMAMEMAMEIPKERRKTLSPSSAQPAQFVAPTVAQGKINSGVRVVAGLWCYRSDAIVVMVMVRYCAMVARAREKTAAICCED